ncbi:GntR family transcriptional regulator [Pseudorhodoferax aquiterrae]|uniref:GntR family transcriptional regulator n=1 Tax=Pseudorhodoferax aquiterrae TaxID=747304 RepID=A0ABQ3G464_9BURK|nr:GntR family transcriptional regulator [Pseudorhodoferax aquiterrae]GHC88798.1 GntR family transcriptional regulator [Pseudorhodoferax aquiterrae]
MNLESADKTGDFMRVQNGRDKAYETLRQRLVGGHYGPGEQLKEEPLARELGLSRTPVRTALRRLVEDGLATDAAGQGIRVAEWSDWDVEETFQLRMLLEPYASFLAATRGGAAVVEKLEASNAAMAAGIAAGSDGIGEVQSANRDFHHALLEASGSPRLRTILVTMIDMPIIKRSFYLYTPQELEQSLHHHRDLTLAVHAQDGELARQVMQLHLRMSYHRFMVHRDEYRRVSPTPDGEK